MLLAYPVMPQHVTPSAPTWCLPVCSSLPSFPQPSPGLVTPPMLPAWLLDNQCFIYQPIRETYMQKDIPHH